MDTNVWVVADGGHDDASQDCVERCLAFLRGLEATHKLTVDQYGEDCQIAILDEYRGNLSSGGYLYKFLNRLQQRSLITYVEASNCEEDPRFTEHPSLCTFDRSDRKFVVVALSSDPPRPVYNAADTGWAKHQEALRELGLEVT